MFTVDLFLNEGGFFGDNQQVTAIHQQLDKEYRETETIRFVTYKDNDATTPQQLSDNFETSDDQEHIFILSGSHGFEFIQKNPKVQAIIGQKKPIVIWFGHQDPVDLVSLEKHLNIVALPKYIFTIRPELKSLFAGRYIEMQSVPNTLTEEALSTAKKTWDSAYPQEAIRPASNSCSYMGVFLGGDAPKRDKTHLYWDEKEAYEQGLAFGAIAQKEKKHLLITNGPRTGKFDPQSPDPKNPVVRAPHTESSPLDPVSVAFLTGLKKSGIPDTQYQFFDFKFGKPPKSAYKAIIAALRETPNSVAVYSGESISYAEIAYFIPQTYAFLTSSMHDEHHEALQQFETLGLIRILNFEKPLSTQLIDILKQQVARRAGANDIDNIIRRLNALKKPDNTSQKGFMPLLETVQQNALPKPDVLPDSQHVQVTPKTLSPSAQPVGMK